MAGQESDTGNERRNPAWEIRRSRSEDGESGRHHHLRVDYIFL